MAEWDSSGSKKAFADKFKKSGSGDTWKKVKGFFSSNTDEQTEALDRAKDKYAAYKPERPES